MKQELHSRVNGRLKDLYELVRSQPIARLIYRDFLTDSERHKIPNDPQSLMNLVSHCAKFRRRSPERILLDMAFEVQVLDGGDYQRLRREIREPIEGRAAVRRPMPKKIDTLTPTWDPARGKLFLGKYIIRKVRVCRTRTRPQIILDAFQSAKWPHRIPEPFNGELPEDNLNSTISELNQGLSRIRFHGQRGGKEIFWDFETQVKPK